MQNSHVGVGFYKVTKMAKYEIKLTSIDLEILRNSIKYLSQIEGNSKQFYYFKKIIDTGYYNYDELEENLKYIISEISPSLELGKFVYLISLIDQGIVSWLIATKIDQFQTPYNVYYYLCLAAALTGQNYHDLNQQMQNDLIFNYLIIVQYNIKKYSKSINPNFDFLIATFSDMLAEWNLNAVFYKQLKIHSGKCAT